MRKINFFSSLIPTWLFTSNKSAHFTASDGSQYVNFGSVVQQDFNHSFAISWWHKTTDTLWCPIVGNQSSVNGGWCTYVRGNLNNIALIVADGVSRFHTCAYGMPSGITKNDGKWHHCVIMYYGTAIIGGGSGYITSHSRAYVDNQLCSVNGGDSYDFTIPVPTGTLQIAKQYTTRLDGGGIHSFVGDLTDISIWPIELTAGEVSAIYNSGHPGDLHLHSRWNDLDNSTRGLWVVMETASAPADISPLGTLYDRKSSNIYNGTGTGNPTLTMDTP